MTERVLTWLAYRLAMTMMRGGMNPRFVRTKIAVVVDRATKAAEVDYKCQVMFGEGKK